MSIQAQKLLTKKRVWYIEPSLGPMNLLSMVTRVSFSGHKAAGAWSSQLAFI